MMMKLLVSLFFLFLSGSSFTQTLDDNIRSSSVQTVQLFQRGNQSSYPVVALGSAEGLELHFDDLGTQIKNYSYTYQLCNADWTPVDLNVFDFIKGFSQSPLRQYRASSLSATRYIHYQAFLPDAGSMPTKSGNYILKVFLNGDTSKLAFTKRFLVYENRVGVGGQILQPFNPQVFRTHQRIEFSIDKTKLSLVNPSQQLKVAVLQNYRWDNAVTNLQPTFIKLNSLEYTGDAAALFPGNSEYRWADLRSFRFRSERVRDIKTINDSVHIYLRPDVQSAQRYFFTSDRNGFFDISSTDLSNGYWQGEYGYVHFVYKPIETDPSKEYYVGGQFTSYTFNNDTKLKYNSENNWFETVLKLKQGFYTYNFFQRKPTERGLTFEPINNYIETENDYTVLVYYRSLSGRHDELIGISTLNSRNLRNGF
jgi:hypothetical protein